MDDASLQEKCLNPSQVNTAVPTLENPLEPRLGISSKSLSGKYGRSDKDSGECRLEKIVSLNPSQVNTAVPTLTRNPSPEGAELSKSLSGKYGRSDKGAETRSMQGALV